MPHLHRILVLALAASLVACTSPFDDAYDAGLMDSATRADAATQDGATADGASDAGVDAPAVDAARDAPMPMSDAGSDAGNDAAIAMGDAGHDAAAAVDAASCTTTAACGPSCVDCLAPGGLLNVTGATCTAAGTCDYGACATAYSDCDGSRANGCERAWSATRCGAACTDCSTTVLNAVSTCSGTGTCDYTACSVGFVDCNMTRQDGCEHAQDVTHCGAACTSCTATVQHATGANCVAAGITGGTCDYTACSGSFSNCDGLRTNGCETAWSASTCGGACTNCTTTVQRATGATCAASGTCDYATCAMGASDCDATRVDGCETWTPSACGPTCTNCVTAVLNATPVCTGAGACDYTVCSGTFRNCDMDRTNGCEHVQDANHCGSGCQNCATGFLHGTPGCPSSVCTVASCTMGYVNCNGMVADGCEILSAGTNLDCCQVSCNTGGGFTCQGSVIAGFSCR